MRLLAARLTKSAAAWRSAAGCQRCAPRSPVCARLCPAASRVRLALVLGSSFTPPDPLPPIHTHTIHLQLPSLSSLALYHARVAAAARLGCIEPVTVRVMSRRLILFICLTTLLSLHFPFFLHAFLTPLYNPLLWGYLLFLELGRRLLDLRTVRAAYVSRRQPSQIKKAEEKVVVSGIFPPRSVFKENTQAHSSLPPVMSALTSTPPPPPPPL